MDAEAKVIEWGGYLVKGDAVSVQGVWLNFPRAASLGHGALVAAARLYEEQADREARSHRGEETPGQRRKRLVEEIEARIVRDAEDDLFVMTL